MDLRLRVDLCLPSDLAPPSSDVSGNDQTLRKGGYAAKPVELGDKIFSICRFRLEEAAKVGRAMGLGEKVGKGPGIADPSAVGAGRTRESRLNFAIEFVCPALARPEEPGAGTSAAIEHKTAPFVPVAAGRDHRRIDKLRERLGGEICLKIEHDSDYAIGYGRCDLIERRNIES